MKRKPTDLISRRNYSDTRDYLRYCLEVRQNGKRSVELYRVSLDHLLRWSTSVLFSQVPQLRPVFPVYVADLDVGFEHQKKILSTTRRFFEWALGRWPGRYDVSKLPPEWIATLQPTKPPEEVPVETDFYSLDEVLALCSLPTPTLKAKRDQAAIALLFLSGMRSGALCTLPLEAVDLSVGSGRIRQWPALGVRTKGGKAANTWLLQNGELHTLRTICVSWFECAHEALGNRGMWYALLTRSGKFAEIQEPAPSRPSNLRRTLKSMCEAAGVEYRRPHSLRHAHAVYALSKCASLDEFKAVSQNLMHSTMTTTDAVYSQMLDDQVADRIANLGTQVQDERVNQLIRELFKSSELRKLLA